MSNRSNVMPPISLAAARVNAGLTQKEFASAVDVTEATVINWEAGRSLPSIGKLSKIEEALGMSINFIRFGK